ncbi:MAG: transglutaminase-like cysteine peptidase [Mariprofundus sp.]|nr:transglutaminase-like cysteine peptidase [Mariprofundus sp.]
MMKIKPLMVLCIMLIASITLAGNFGFSPQFLDDIAERYGFPARDRLVAWQDMVEDIRDDSEFQDIQTVNYFFNQVRFISDKRHWQRNDYWATPVEFLSTDGGDCEDFSIAKYFTLRELGVPDEKLRITYVKALELNQAHMVLAYYATPDSDPLILDNLIKDIHPASERQDLLPVYSFNGKDLWMSKERGQGRQIAGGSGRINLWRDLKIRMQQERNLGRSYTAQNMMGE